MKFKKTSHFYAAGILLILFIGLSSFIWLDDDPIIVKIVTQLDKWITEYQPEKVYLQLDKPYYTAGDNIWFKAYVTVGVKHQLSMLSGAVNVELIDEQDSVKQWIKLPLTIGVAWGNFELPDTLHEGNYRIRAYTNWMRNAGPDYYFDKSITIGNAATNTVFIKTAYTYATIKNQQKVAATINYADINGAPYTGKPLTYRVEFADKTAARGKGITDDKGNIVIDFTNPASAQLNKGNIITDIKLNEKTTVTKTIAINPTSGKVDVQFFPESANLVNGLRSKVAFKAVGPNGLGVNIKGVVIDNENNKLSEFSTQHLGMGAFILTPQSGKTYKALITYPDGSENTVNLPAALNSGYVLSINNRDSANISLNVMGSADLANAGQIYIFAQSGGETCYVAKNRTSGTTFNATISKSRFPSGIVQFTLFSSTGEPLNERIAFIQHNENLLKLNINSEKAVSAVRQKVKIDLDAQTSSGKPVIGTFSAAVIDESKVKSDESAITTIMSQILLSSDLRGYVEQPNYYFTGINETTRADLDILMLTQGYRRFDWKPLLAGTITPPAHQPEKLIKISGNIKTLGGKPVASAKVTLFSIGSKKNLILDTVADVNGKFAFEGLFLKDSTRFVIQARTPKNGKNVEIKVDDNGNEDVTTKNKYLPTANYNNEQLSAYLKANKSLYDEELKYGLGNHTLMLKEVTVKDKRKTELEHSDNLNGPGNADQVITSDVLDKRGCATIDQCLQGLVNFVNFRNGMAYSTRSPNSPMQIILDGIPIDDLTIISPSDIASVEVLRSGANTAIYGSRGGGGVLIFTTKRGDSGQNNARTYAPGLITYSPKGYYYAREFYSPQYDDPKTNKSVADLRTTIYWNPNIVTDKTGHASLNYYNAGSPGTYSVIIEGIDTDGNLGHGVYRYKVQ